MSWHLEVITSQWGNDLYTKQTVFCVSDGHMCSRIDCCPNDHSFIKVDSGEVCYYHILNILEQARWLLGSGPFYQRLDEDS